MQESGRTPFAHLTESGAFLPPSGGVFRLSHLGVFAGYPMQTVMRFSRYNRQNGNKKF